MPEWFEDYFTGLYAEVLDATFTRERSGEQANLIARLLELETGAAVLDVPCGGGRLSVPLAESGLRVTGIDLSAPLLERARRRARRAKAEIRFIRRDMREIDFEGEFDGAFNWFTSFGYFDDAGNAAFLGKVFRALRPGGRFAVELINKAWLLANYKPVTVDEVAGVHIESRHRFDAAASRTVSETVFEKGGKVEKHNDSIRVYSPPEMEAFLTEAGFDDIRLLAAEGAEPPSPESPRFIAVAVRPGEH